MAGKVSQASMRGRIAANERWARTDDRAAATAPARAGLDARFEAEVDPERKLDPAERSRRVASLRKAHFARLALRSAQARRIAAQARQNARDRQAVATVAEELRSTADILDRELAEPAEAV